MSLKIYNSLTGKKEEFIPHQRNVVNMYVCGPTVYNYIHIGNARPVIFYDMVKNYLEFIGYKVNYASNITDVDDKIINKALAEGKPEKQVANFYEDAYFKAVSLVGSKKPDFIPHATDYIDEMIKFIDELIKAGYAYEKDGDVFFRVSKIENYGELSGQRLEDLESGARIDVDEAKENPFDFSLWKKTETGIKWESPFGAGRPGWHTECVVMNHKLFGENLDIHGGGMDLKFPHHENEISQFKALYHSPLAKYWMHVARLDLGKEKMSKSLGNVIYVKDFDTFEGMILRTLILFTPYRNIISYDSDGTIFNQYKNEFLKWQRAYKMALYELQAQNKLTDKFDEKAIEEFKNFMDDDFNVQNVLMLVNNIFKDINTLYRSKNFDELALKVRTIQIIFDVLGINLFVEKMNKEQLATYKLWQEARNNKNFELADEYRSKLAEWKII